MPPGTGAEAVPARAEGTDAVGKLYGVVEVVDKLLDAVVDIEFPLEVALRAERDADSSQENDRDRSWGVSGGERDLAGTHMRCSRQHWKWR